MLKLNVKTVFYHFFFMAFVAYVDLFGVALGVSPDLITALDEHWKNWQKAFSAWVSPTTNGDISLSDMNNQFNNCSPIMADARQFTIWQPAKLYNTYLQKISKSSNNDDLRQKLINNPQLVLDFENSIVSQPVCDSKVDYTIDYNKIMNESSMELINAPVKQIYGITKHDLAPIN